MAEASGARIRVKTHVSAEMRRMDHIVGWKFSRGHTQLYMDNNGNNHQMIGGLRWTVLKQKNPLKKRSEQGLKIF